MIADRSHEIDRAISMFAAGAIRPDPFVDTVLASLARVEPRLQSLVPEVDRRSRMIREARRLEALFPDAVQRPDLFGFPVAVKDIINVDGLATRAGSSLPAELFAGREATAVRRLKAAGVLVLGKSVTTEFAFADPGPTTNPHDARHTPGGSSSGSAAAVAAGLTPLALGSQSVDSIVTPAAYCGTVGFKPTYGRVPIDGVVPFAPSMDHLGVLGSRVAAVAEAASALCDLWRHIAVAPARRVLIPKGPYLDRASAAGLEAFYAAVDRLAGVTRIVEVAVLDDIEGILATHRALIGTEFALVHRDWFTRHGDRYRSRARALIHEAKGAMPAAASDGPASGTRLRRRLTVTLKTHAADAWLAPATTGPAPRGLDFIGDPAMGVPWTHAGLPVVALPAGTVGGMPVGIQLAGRPGEDEALLTVAGLLEEAAAS